MRFQLPILQCKRTYNVMSNAQKNKQRKNKQFDNEFNSIIDNWIDFIIFLMKIARCTEEQNTKTKAKQKQNWKLR